MAGRSGIEDDMVIPVNDAVVGQERGKFIERCDLGRASARELLLDALEYFFRQRAADRANDTLAILRRRVLRVDFEGIEMIHARNGDDPVADLSFEHLTDIGRRVSADQQHALAFVRQRTRGSASERGFPDPALTGKEHKFWQIIEHGNFHSFICLGDIPLAASGFRFGILCAGAAAAAR